MVEGPPDVRFQRAPGCKHEYGWFRTRLDDGSIEFAAQRNGSIRTMLPERVEFRQRGPRGGVLWVSAEQVERPMDSA